jgi:outer membrane protein
MLTRARPSLPRTAGLQRLGLRSPDQGKILETKRPSGTFQQFGMPAASEVPYIERGEENIMIGRLCRSSLVLFLVAALAAAPVVPAYAQQASGQQPAAQQPAASAPQKQESVKSHDYSVGKRQFPDFVGPYTPIRVADPQLVNSPRLEQMIHDGKLEISLQDAIALALENNLDISIQRYAPWLAETDILRAKGQSSVSGVNLDPVVTSNLFWDRRSSPVNNPFISGTGVVLGSINTNTAQYNFLYSQGFTTGTNYTIGFNNTRSSSSNPANIFNPSVTSSLALAFTQPLLNGFGFAQNRSGLLIAKNNKAIADLTFQQQLITSVTAVSNSYWELVFARNDVKVKQQSVDLAQKLYDDNQRQVAIGTLAQIEVTRAAAQLATAKSDLILSQTNQLQQQTLLRNLITKSPMDPLLQNVEIVPTDDAAEPKFDVIPIQDAVQEALTKRPDVLQARTTLLSDDVSVHSTRRAMLPTLNLSGTYAMSGLAGNTKILGSPVAGLGTQIVDSSGTPQNLFVPTSTRPVIGIAPGGWGDALSSIYNNNFPDYNVGVTLTIPIRNRPAQAANARALLQERQDEARLRQLQNTVVVDVRNAQIALENGRARVSAAAQARVLQEQTLDAEQKKYQLGASTVFQVIQTQRDLATARSTELRALIDMIEAKVTFDRVMGRTLETNKVTIAEAKSGQAVRETRIPGTAVNGELMGVSRKY